MNLESTVSFLQRIYYNPYKHNFTRLEHEALRQAISILSVLLWQEHPGNSEEESKRE